jgi:hypothetical protein
METLYALLYDTVWAVVGHTAKLIGRAGLHFEAVFDDLGDVWGDSDQHEESERAA